MTNEENNSTYRHLFHPGSASSGRSRCSSLSYFSRREESGHLSPSNRHLYKDGVLSCGRVLDAEGDMSAPLMRTAGSSTTAAA